MPGIPGIWVTTPVGNIGPEKGQFRLPRMPTQPTQPSRYGKSTSSRKRVNPENTGGRCKRRRVGRGRSRGPSGRRWFAHGGGLPVRLTLPRCRRVWITSKCPIRRRPRVFHILSHGWNRSCAERSRCSPSSAESPREVVATTTLAGSLTAVIIQPIIPSANRPRHILRLQPRARCRISRRVRTARRSPISRESISGTDQYAPHWE